MTTVIQLAPANVRLDEEVAALKDADAAEAQARAAAIADESEERTAAVSNITSRLDLAEPAIVQSQGLPGDAPGRFTSALTGTALAAPPLATGDAIVNADYSAWRITGSGIVATRERIALEAGRQLAVRYSVRRATDPSDPAGDTVQLGIQWLNKNKAQISQRIVENLNLAVSDGRAQREVVFSDALTGNAAFAWPATARYMVPFVRMFGGDGVTDVEILDWSDVTGLDPLTVQGASNYDLWLSQGNTGTVQDYLDEVETSAAPSAALASQAAITATSALASSVMARDRAEAVTTLPSRWLGRSSTPVTGTAGTEDFVVGLLTPAPYDAVADRVWFFAGPGVSAITLKTFRRMNGAWVQVGTDTVLSAAPGLNDIALADIDVPAGCIPAWYTTGGRIMYGGTPNDAYLFGSAAGNQSTLAAAPGSARRYQIDLRIRQKVVLGRQDFDRTADHVSLISPTKTQVIGVASVTSTTTNAPANTNAYTQGALGPGRLISVLIWGRTVSGLLAIRAGKVVNGDIVPYGPSIFLPVTAIGEKLYTAAAGDFKALPLEAGDVLIYSGSAAIGNINPAPGPAYYFKSGDLIDGTIAAPATFAGSTNQIGFGIEYYDQTAKLVMLTQAAYDALSSKDPATLYAVSA